jgi:hypothetical protein
VILNCGSSLHSAMSSTYWDSAERARIVSSVAKQFLAPGVSGEELCKPVTSC